MTDEPSTRTNSPLFEQKAYDEPSVFKPSSLLDEARRQKGPSADAVPEFCVLDPDGDIVSHPVETEQAALDRTWPGYHTDLY